MTKLEWNNWHNTYGELNYVAHNSAKYTENRNTRTVRTIPSCFGSAEEYREYRRRMGL